MRSLALLLTLLAPLGARAAAPELLCDGDAKVVFQSRWIRPSFVALVGDHTWEMPWTGRESLLRGHELRTLDGADAELAEVQDDVTFVTFRRKPGAPQPLENVLYVQRELVTGASDDGLVVSELFVSASIEPGAAPARKVRVYHCRRR